MIQSVPRAIALLTFVLLLFFFGFCIAINRTDFFAIDHCLDIGGRWNYELRECEGERSDR